MGSWEGLGGRCPNCGFDRLHLLHATGGWTQFEACSRCGYALLESLTCTDDGTHVPAVREHQDVWEAEFTQLGSRERAYWRALTAPPGPDLGNVFAEERTGLAARLARLRALKLPVFNASPGEATRALDALEGAGEAGCASG